MFPIKKEVVSEIVERLSIQDLKTATIRQICTLAEELERSASEEMVHLEIGNPGNSAEQIGVEAEVKALQSGIANQYPNIAGLAKLKQSGSEFIKAFMNLDIPARCVIPTVGSMQGCFTLMLSLSQRLKGKDTILFLSPGFSVQHNQARLLGLKEESFDIYSYRGRKLEEKMESILSKGHITGILYNTPNNPSWTNLTEEELEIIGRLATKYDAIVIEDLAYFGMDFRKDISRPYEPPYSPTVGRYTDNYVLMLSGSKIFSYAGQRIAIVAMSPTVFDRRYDTFREQFRMPAFGDAFIYTVLYCSSSGTAHSAQYALAAMFEAAVKGELNFVEHCKVYAHKAAIAKNVFLKHGFHIVYEYDGEEPISDGFFFTVGYKDMTGYELQLELLRYGVATVSLLSAGSEQEGVRICISMVPDDKEFEKLDRYLAKFEEDKARCNG